jgi:hypothetical protein
MGMNEFYHLIRFTRQPFPAECRRHSRYATFGAKFDIAIDFSAINRRRERRSPIVSGASRTAEERRSSPGSLMTALLGGLRGVSTRMPLRPAAD